MRRPQADSDSPDPSAFAAGHAPTPWASWLILVLSLAGTGRQSLASDVYYVDDDAAPGGRGLSWADAFDTLSAALEVAVAGDEIRIAHGVYKPGGPGSPTTSTFAVEGEALIQGGFAGLGADDPDLYDPKQFITTLSGDLDGDDGPDFANYTDNCLHVVTIQQAPQDAQLKGLAIYGGHAIGDEPWSPESHGAGVNCLVTSTLVLHECTFDRNQASGSGAGLHASEAQVVINSCSFLKNETIHGGGGQGGAGACIQQGIVTESLFSECIAPYYVSFNGGGILCSSAAISNCQFVDCVGSGVSCGSNTNVTSCEFIGNYGEEGGGLAMNGDNVHILNSTFLDNSAGYGGALASSGDGHVVADCLFLSNHAGSEHSAVEIKSGSVSLVNCLISGGGPGAATLGSKGEVTLDNCTFSANGNSFAGTIWVHPRATSYNLRNCILWGNTSEDYVGEAAQIDAFGPISIDNSCVEGWTGALGGVGNDGLDPLFIDADGPDDIPGTLDDDCRLSADSPSRNAGSNDFLPLDTLDLDGDGDTGEPLPLDLDLLPRVSQGIVDRGPYEFHPICPADLFPDEFGIGDGLIGPGDLAQLLAGWGPCSGPCPADLWPDGAPDGQVTAADLATLLSQWGQCP